MNNILAQNAFFRLHVWFRWLMLLRALSLPRRSFCWPGRPYCWNCHTFVPHSYYHYSCVSFVIMHTGERSTLIFCFRFIMHQQKTGLFKRSSNSNINSRRSTNESLTRTVLMSQESKNEYEKANKEANVTLIQFDLSKTPAESQRLV